MLATSFGDILWLIIISFFFITYLMMLFSVIGDIFRNHEMSGVMKAVWLVLLFALPLLTLLIYVIVNGAGMAKRSMKEQQDAKAAFDDYVRQAAGTGGAASELANAKSLLDSGAITADEYAKLKAKIIG
ncbi:MAG: SHOCT domain-containing protein [Acidobacteria bacterium]|nr:SHOCT domain-containing protein [Acidobacteriota bacterium]